MGEELLAFAFVAISGISLFLFIEAASCNYEAHETCIDWQLVLQKDPTGLSIHAATCWSNHGHE